MTTRQKKPQNLAAGSYDFQKLRKGDEPAKARQDESADTSDAVGARSDQKRIERTRNDIGVTEKILVHDAKEKAKPAPALETEKAAPAAKAQD